MALAGHFRVALVSLFQNESSCKTCHVKNESICMINTEAKGNSKMAFSVQSISALKSLKNALTTITNTHLHQIMN